MDSSQELNFSTENENKKSTEGKNTAEFIPIDRRLITPESKTIEFPLSTEIYDADNLNDGLISQLKEKINFKPEISSLFEDESVIHTKQEVNTLADLSPKKCARRSPFFIKDISSLQDDGDTKKYTDRIIELNKTFEYPKADLSQNLDGLQVPEPIWNNLFQYQRDGLEWFWGLHKQGVGGILSDEMGLGKTVQVVCFLGCLHFSKEFTSSFKSALIICPATLLKIWLREFFNWWPYLRVVILHRTYTLSEKPSNFLKKVKKLQDLIVITTYGTFLRYQKNILEQNWQYVILDEGHKIKNPKTHSNMFALKFKTPHRIIISGTPIQNNLIELWSLFDFVYPGLLGTLSVFKDEVALQITKATYSNATPLQVQTGFKCAKMLKNVIKPYLLRRTKKQVKEYINLPDKHDYVLYCCLTKEQSKLYKNYINNPEFINTVYCDYKQMLKGIMILRKICNHPCLVDDNPLQLNWKYSSKLLTLHSLLLDWYKNKNRALVYSQSTKMLNIIEKYCSSNNFTYLRLDGKIPVSCRQTLIDNFNEDSSIFLFLLTTKVGGEGINLIGADRVVIFDPDWNPSIDTQAKERVWRIGQTRPVTIFRLLTSGTIEEKMYNRQIFKQFIANKVLDNPQHVRAKLNFGDIHELFSYSESNKNASKCDDLVIDNHMIDNTPKKRKYKWRKDEFSFSDDEITPLFLKKSNIIKKIKQIKDKSGLTDISLIEQQAQIAATNAISTMTNSSPSALLNLSNKSEGISILNSLKSFSALNIQEQFNNSGNLSINDVPLALKSFLKSKNGNAKTSEIINYFKEKIKLGIDTITFKQILRSMCEFKVDQSSKTGSWYLKDSFID